MDRLNEVRVPTLLLGGELDEVTPAHLADMHALIHGSELKVLPRSGHMPYLEGPATVRAVLTAMRLFMNRTEAMNAP